MEIIKGIGVSPGVAICSAIVLDADQTRISRNPLPGSDSKNEVRRLQKAFADASQEVAKLQISQSHIWDNKVQDIFAVHMHFLKDKNLRQKIEDILQQEQYSAEYAVSVVLRDISKHFSQTEDKYISERVNDIYDIERRLLRHLAGERREDLHHLTDEVIVVAHDLTPTQTVAFDKRFVKALATDAGGRTSHTAIVARSLGIPAVVALGEITQRIAAGDLVIVDGHRGTVVIDPDQATIDEYKRHAAAYVEHEHELDEVLHLPSQTQDGAAIKLQGNIEFPHEADIAMAKGAEGIGLYRTEFLYLEADHEPTEEDHYQAYLTTLRCFGSQPITIRTFDLGADKFTQRQKDMREPNPFLGLRSIRYCLQNLDMFKTQLRAILRVSAHGNIRMMLPLITNIVELRQTKWILAEVKEDLEEQGIAFNENMPVGIMIETPGAALTADHLADEVDFFSVGTNDLIQYTLAVDRINQKVASLYSPGHPAVLYLLRHVVQAARRAKIEISLCGEMASEKEFIPLLLGLGYTTLSLAPPMIPEIKKVIRSVTMEQCRAIARKAMSFDTDDQTLRYLRTEIQDILPNQE